MGSEKERQINARFQNVIMEHFEWGKDSFFQFAPLTYAVPDRLPVCALLGDTPWCFAFVWNYFYGLAEKDYSIWTNWPNFVWKISYLLLICLCYTIYLLLFYISAIHTSNCSSVYWISADKPSIVTKFVVVVVVVCIS